ncbi:head-tail connector protein [Priestia megaterium]
MIVSLEQIKQYLRVEIDYFDEDYFLESLILMSEEYIFNATGFKFDDNAPEIAKHIVRLLVSHWYENREIVSTQLSNKVDFTVNALLFQLKNCYFPPGSGEITP